MSGTSAEEGEHFAAGLSQRRNQSILGPPPSPRRGSPEVTDMSGGDSILDRSLGMCSLSHTSAPTPFESSFKSVILVSVIVLTACVASPAPRTWRQDLLLGLKVGSTDESAINNLCLTGSWNLEVSSDRGAFWILH